jgi:acyl-CoA reductase-like NAD-dependent aldehyde dehydrogenase
VGNTVIHKASEECVLSGKLFADIMEQVGLPTGVFSAIHGDGQQGAHLVTEPVDLIWFTGSSEVGKTLYQTAAKKFIRVVLEMGGSNPAVVFEDVAAETIIPTLKFKRFAYCGQTCDAVKRLIVHENIADAVISQLKTAVESIVVGDPQDPKTELGPLVSLSQRDLLSAQVADAVKKGATVICGGRAPDLSGAYYMPTILTNIKKSMRVWQEEVFGPVLSVVTFQTEEEAISLANDTRYGLGAQVYSQDTHRALRVASRIQAGSVDINGASHFKPFNPFGGYKESGLGKEHGLHGFRELCQMKVVSLKK